MKVIKNVTNFKNVNGHWHLIGEVVEHDVYPKGHSICTSRVVALVSSNPFAFDTLNSTYYIESFSDSFDYSMLQDISTVGCE